MWVDELNNKKSKYCRYFRGELISVDVDYDNKV